MLITTVLALAAVACGGQAPQDDEPAAKEESSALTTCAGTCQQRYYATLAGCNGDATCDCLAYNAYQRCVAVCQGRTPILRQC
jgi:hypothetical protein